MNKNRNKSRRHPTERRKQISTPSPPLVSYGTNEKKVLEYVAKLTKYTNKSKIARSLKIPRTTLLSVLSRLKQKGLLEQLPNYTLVLTTKGKELLSTFTEDLRGVDGLGWGCRESTLSVHYLRFILPLTNGWDKFDKIKIKSLNVINSKELKNKNMPQHYLYFENATIIINKHQIAIRIHDTIEQDTETAIFRAMNKALEFLPLIKSLGLVTSEIHLDDPHFARVESLLADSLQKIDKRYFLQLDDGTKFWIDNSGKSINPEDETNREKARLRVDRLITQIIENDIDLRDLNKLKEVTSDLTKFTINNFLETNKDIKKLIIGLDTFIEISTQKNKPIRYKQDKSKIDYVG